MATWGLKKKYGITRKEMKRTRWTPPGESAPLCACGCGSLTSFNYNTIVWNTVVSGHNARISNPMAGKTHSESTRKAISVRRSQGLKTGHIVTWNKGLTKETDDRVKRNGQHTSESMQRLGTSKGENNPMFWTKGSMYGKVHSAETKQKCSEARKKYYREHPDFNKRERNGRWKGGIPSEYPPEWTKELRRSIRRRDSYTCQICDESNKTQRLILDVHHIDEDKNNCSPSNLITLCKSCHCKLHGGTARIDEVKLRCLKGEAA